MKGIVFTEFLEMVEDVFGPDVADQILDRAELKSGGAYTSVGTYDHREMLALVGALAETSGTDPAALVQTFGRHLLSRFHALYGEFFESHRTVESFLSSVEGQIHIEVRKLYPDAELPRFATTNDEAGNLQMTYRSSRPFADLAHGLIEGAVQHFGGNAELRRSDSSDFTTFTVVRN